MKKSFQVIPLIIVSVLFFSCDVSDGGMVYNSPNAVGEYIGMPDVSGENYAEYEENPFVKVNEQAVSTFSIDADGASYSNTRRFLNNGMTPPPEAVRIEEYINYFTFDYVDPIDEENIALSSELVTCPWYPGHHIMRLGIKGKSISHDEIPACNYVFLIDVSGSMNTEYKLGILKEGFAMMTDNLRDEDRVAIVTYAGSAAVLLQSTPGNEKQTIKSAINKLGAGGSTAGAAGIKTAYEIAVSNYIQDGNNRVILGSDGDFNVGPSSTDELIELIEEKRATGIYLTVLGVGGGNLNDNMMERIANKGNGNYEYIDNAAQLKKVFVYERSRFYAIAKDSKIQITFDPRLVDSYRLIGYENRMLEEDDFENDTVDAGEIGAGQTITALYELVLANQGGEGAYAQFDFRYKKPESDLSRLISHPVSETPVLYKSSTENTRFAMSLVCFGLIARESQYAGDASIQLALSLGEDALSFDPYGFRHEYIDLVKMWE